MHGSGTKGKDARGKNEVFGAIAVNPITSHGRGRWFNPSSAHQLLSQIYYEIDSSRRQ
jgi:hypothetical protein